MPWENRRERFGVLGKNFYFFYKYYLFGIIFCCRNKYLALLRYHLGSLCRWTAGTDLRDMETAVKNPGTINTFLWKCGSERVRPGAEACAAWRQSARRTRRSILPRRGQVALSWRTSGSLEEPHVLVSAGDTLMIPRVWVMSWWSSITISLHPSGGRFNKQCYAVPT